MDLLSKLLKYFPNITGNKIDQTHGLELEKEKLNEEYNKIIEKRERFVRRYNMPYPIPLDDKKYNVLKKYTNPRKIEKKDLENDLKTLFDYEMTGIVHINGLSKSAHLTDRGRALLEAEEDLRYEYERFNKIPKEIEEINKKISEINKKKEEIKIGKVGENNNNQGSSFNFIKP